MIKYNHLIQFYITTRSRIRRIQIPTNILFEEYQRKSIVSSDYNPLRDEILLIAKELGKKFSCK